MKSKRAEELMNLNLFDRKYNDGWIRECLRLDVATSAVELAEADMRAETRSECKERAVKAFCEICGDSDITKEMKGCYTILRCKNLREYLKAYGNDRQ